MAGDGPKLRPLLHYLLAPQPAMQTSGSGGGAPAVAGLATGALSLAGLLAGGAGGTAGGLRLR